MISTGENQTSPSDVQYRPRGGRQGTQSCLLLQGDPFRTCSLPQRSMNAHFQKALSLCLFQTESALLVLGQSEPLQEDGQQLYLPLKSNTAFRVLALEPGREEDPIRCSFVYIDFKIHCPTYEAISYVWGTTSNRVAISCEQDTIQITRNLYNIL